MTIEAEPIPLNRPDTDPQTLHIKYPSLYEPNPYIADEVKVEVSVRSLQWPYARVEILSMVSEEKPSEAYAETPFAIEAVEPHKTFLEKAAYRCYAIAQNGTTGKGRWGTICGRTD